MTDQINHLKIACEESRLLGRAVHVLSVIANGLAEDPKALAAANLMWLEERAKPDVDPEEVQTFGFGA